MNFLLQPWPWYVSGPLIGLMVPALLIFGNKSFGISVTFRHFCAACLPSKNPFFNYDWKKEMWVIVLALGMILGGLVSHNFMSEKDVPIALSKEAKKMFSDHWKLSTGFWGDTRLIIASEAVEGIELPPNKKIIMPSEIFSFDAFSSPIGWIFMVLGGFLVGFGTRWANGCTSGHAIMGLSMLNPGSLVAVIGFFIGGLTVSWFVIPILL